MFSMPVYVHPRLVETWDRLSSGLVQHATPDRAWPERLFVSRRHDKRACTNRPEVEALFAEHGFEVVYPEEHPLPDQAAMFARAEVIAGFAGSGMFSLIFADRPKHVILIGSTSYRASNEYMISALRGHRLDISTSTDDAEQPENRWTKRAFGQQFTVDMTREGAWLREVLGQL
jgi:capsular polysaccharide biosynthesis protein